MPVTLHEYIKTLSSEPEENDIDIFHSLINTELAPWQEEQIRTPQNIYPREQNILAVHWHPEFVPFPLIQERLTNLYPNVQNTLIIPTQHNEILYWNNCAGVEVDCYSRGFNQKVQLLLHFSTEVARSAHTLSIMLDHTKKYRSTQLFDFLHALTQPNLRILDKAAHSTGASEDIVIITQIFAKKIEKLFDMEWNSIPEDMLKNKLIRDFVDAHRSILDMQTVEHIQAFLKSIKNQVKDNFALDYFYRTSEIIEETRSLGGGIVIPHPEQFWPILLAGYDVDGYEIWNPQSQRYSEFLISAVQNQNARRRVTDREILIFMGDDCHMSEKTRPQDQQDKHKASREIGLQAWDDLNIRKTLLRCGSTRQTIMKEYMSRLKKDN